MAERIDPISGLGKRWRELADDGSNMQLEDLPSFHFVRIAVQFRRRITQRALEAAGLSYAEWRVLGLVGRYTSIPTPDVARMSLMDKAQISRAVETLVGKGLVRQTDDPDHARRRILLITDAGRETLHRALVVVRQAQARLLAVFNADERVLLGHFLERISHWLDEIEP